MIMDDNFTVNHARSIHIARTAKKKGVEFHTTWYADVPALQNSELLLEVAPFTHTFAVGAESFDPQIIKRIGKKFKPEDIVAGALNARKCGMSHKVLFSFIIGFPWQNKEMIIEEINRMYDLVISTGIKVLINWLVVTPGSRLWTDKFKQPAELKTWLSQLAQAQENIHSLSKPDMEEINMYIKVMQLTTENLLTKLVL
jgi:radical SAM superfamily enzyme YgiQ (UPF0313 family)